MSEDKKLVERLRKTFHKGIPVNPDGPEAADRIEAQAAENERLREALEEWVFLYAWKAEGMNIEQARIHAKAFMARAALGGNDE